MQQKINQKYLKKLKSLYHILATMVWRQKTSHATVSLREEKKMALMQGKPGDVSRGFGELERVSWGGGGNKAVRLNNQKVPLP